MKKIVLASLIISLIFAGVYTTDAATTKAPKPMKGQVVSLDDVIKGVKDLQLTKARAEELVAAGSPLVFLYNKKIYFVQNEDGSFAFKKLASYALNKNVGIVGKTKTVKGINIIIMSGIESMD
jgi:hypothetical protein